MQSMQTDTQDSIRTEAVVAHGERESLGRQVNDLSAEVRAVRRKLEWRPLTETAL
jgi:hypothetical protein